MPDGRRPTSSPTAHRITCATAAEVVCDPPVQTPAGEQNRLPVDKFQVTDPALGLKPDNSFQKSKSGHPGFEIVGFGNNAGDLAGRTPSVNDNPYNFVAFAGREPWTESPPHPDHACWQQDAFSGVLEIEAEAVTPVFIPMGFPFEPRNEQEKEQLRRVPRHFFRLRDADGKLRYAVPGSSLKGVLRAGVEALTNSLCGEVNVADYEKPIPYRRRVFHAGRLTNQQGQDWQVQPIRVNTRQQKGWRRQPYLRNLLAQKAASGPGHLWWTPEPSQRCLSLPQDVICAYWDNLEHPHYETHFRERRAKPSYDHSCYPASWEQAKQHLASLRKDTIIYYTEENSKITTFGKNVNYLWPAKKSVRDLAGAFFPPCDGRRGLSQDLSLAERMFGFSGKHERERCSHPYQGKIRCTPLWSQVEADSFQQEANWEEASILTGPPSTKGIKIRLAPLTAPETRAKARPLYLVSEASNTTGRSASYDDPDVELMGRKFYWHQKSQHPSGIAPHHLYDPAFHQSIAKQCPPPLYALRAGMRFSGHIYFDNLTAEELGALLYAIEGDGRYDHAVKIGKGKPRGLGSMRVRVTGITLLDPQERYRSLVGTPAQKKLDEQEGKGFKNGKLKEFETWTLRKAGRSQGSLSSLPHIQDYDALHNWSCAAPRYYPINFSAYSWLPRHNDAAGEPARGGRPPAMPRARRKPGC